MSEPYKIFDITGVPAEEIEEVRTLLYRKKVKFYETPAANFGRSNAAIWVRTEKEFNKARALLDEYQISRKTLRERQEGAAKVNSSSGNKTKVLFLVFVLVIMVWMYFFGAWRP